MQGSVAFIAAPYGFGPTSKAVAIASHIPNSTDKIFFGHGPALTMARLSKAFTSCITLDFDDKVEHIVEQISCYDLVVFVNTTRFVAAAATIGKPLILVETLAWLRDTPPSCFPVLTKYFAQRFFHHPFSPEMEAIDTFTAVGAILPMYISQERRAERSLNHSIRSPLLHCGGLFSPAMIENADRNFVAQAISALGYHGRFARGILPSYLIDQIDPSSEGNVEFVSCSPMSVHNHVIGSEFCLTTTGIEFTYESLALGVPTFFLPPFNASQQFQLSYLKRICPSSIPFADSGSSHAICFQILNQLTASIQSTGLQGLWADQFAEVGDFLGKHPSNEFDDLINLVRENQKRDFDRISDDGAQTIAAYLVRHLCLESLSE